MGTTARLARIPALHLLSNQWDILPSLSCWPAAYNPLACTHRISLWALLWAVCHVFKWHVWAVSPLGPENRMLFMEDLESLFAVRTFCVKKNSWMTDGFAVVAMRCPWFNALVAARERRNFPLHETCYPGAPLLCNRALPVGPRCTSDPRRRISREAGD